ncbi:MAG: hypothetical protein ACREMW_02640, partial [Gemmatimonadales bacterium]
MAHELQSFVEGPDELRARLARVKAVLAAHKLRFPRGSRFARFEKLAERFAAKKLSPLGVGSRRDVDLLLEGNRDFADLA